MIYTTAIIGFVLIGALLAFFWKQSQFGSGRAFGNRIAAHCGIPGKVFHMLLAHGVEGDSADFLAALEQSTTDLDQAGVALGPTLAKGTERMEARFGNQEMIDKVKPIVAKLVSEFEMKG